MEWTFQQELEDLALWEEPLLHSLTDSSLPKYFSSQTSLLPPPPLFVPCQPWLLDEIVLIESHGHECAALVFSEIC